MTYGEKYQKEHPEHIGRGHLGRCPEYFRYEEESECPYVGPGACEECWNREMPEPEELKNITEEIK